MSLSKPHVSRRHRLSAVVGAVLVSALLGAACDETLGVTPVPDAGSDATGGGGDSGGGTDASQNTDGTTGNDSSVSTDATTDSTTDAPTDGANESSTDGSSDAQSDATSDATSDAQGDSASDAGADVDAGPAFCVTNPLDVSDAQIISINYLIALGGKCQTAGFIRSTNMETVEDCFNVFLREQLGCPGVTYAGTISGATGEACGGFFVHPLDGASFSNSDFDQAMAALVEALDGDGYFTAPAERAAFLSAMNASRSRVVTSSSSGLTHSTCDAGTDGGDGG